MSTINSANPGINELTGDVTAGPGSGSQAATIAADAVTNTKMANVATSTFKGRATSGTGDPEDLSVAQAKTLLDLAGSNTGDQTITLSGAVTGSGTGAITTAFGDATITALAAYNTNGLLTQTAADTFTGRTITGTTNRLSVTNGDGVSGNPTLDISSSYVGQSTITTLGTITTGVWNATDIAVVDGGTGASTASAARTNLGITIGTDVQAYDPTLTAFAAYNTNGLLTQTAADTFTGRTITGTSNRLTVTNGDGVSGNPTLDISTSYVGQATITTLGTITTGVWTGTTIAVANGGTGQTSYTDGQLLIGNTTGNTLAKATLTGTANQVVVTNGGGSITLSTPQNIGTGSSPTFAGMTLSGMTLGSVLFAGTGGVVSQDNANLFWDDTNNRLGIGITSPAASIDVYKSPEAVVRISGTRANFVSNSVGSIEFYNTSPAKVIAKIEVSTQDNWSDNGRLIFHTKNGGGSDANPLTEVGCFTDVGAFGVGVSNPQMKIESSKGFASRSSSDSVGSSTDCAFIFGAVGGPDYITFRRTSTGDNFAMDTYDGSAWNQSLTILRANGRIGINSTSPSAKLHVISTTEQVRIGYDTSNYYSTTVGSTGVVTFNAVGSGSAFSFSDNVGIAVTSPLVKLDVRGSAMFGRTSLFSGGTFAVDAYYATNPLADNETASGVVSEIDTTNDSYAGYQSTAVQATVRYRGSQSESVSGKGSRSFDASMFVYNTATTQHASGMRMDIRNLGVGTVTNLYGNWVTSALNSGGGTITNIYGIKVDAQTVATNNYGIHLNNAAAANRWNIYALGTANNYLAGSLGIGNSAPQKSLEISAAADPTLRLSEASSTTSYMEIVDFTAGVGQIKKTTASGNATVDIDPIPSDGTSSALYRIWRTTNTSGACTIQLFRGNGSATLDGQISSGTTASYLGVGGGSFGVGVASLSAKFHVLATTEQLRVGYDASNYYSTTVSSTGGVTFNAVGSGSAFVFSDPVDVQSSLQCDSIVNDTGLAAGTYTPTLTNVANLTSTAFECQYMRVGNTVTVSGKVNVDPTLAATSTQLGISLPVASDFGAAEDCGGVAFAPGIAGQGAGILADATNNRAQMQWVSGDVTAQDMYFTFTYSVI